MAATASTSRGSARAGCGVGTGPVGGVGAAGVGTYGETAGRPRLTINLHKDGLILCEYGIGLSHGSLSVSHPLREGRMGSLK